jgi:hypothetical protein
MTPLNNIPLVQTNILSFALLNIILTHYEAIANRHILDITATPPSSPSDGDAYLIASSPTGLWAGQPFKLTFSLGSVWYFLDLPPNTLLYHADGSSVLVNGSSFTRLLKPGTLVISPSSSLTLSLSKNNILTPTTSAITVTSAFPFLDSALVINKSAFSVDLLINSSIATIPPTSSRILVGVMGGVEIF